MNSHFINSVNEITSKIPVIDEPPLFISTINESIVLEPTHEQEVLNVIDLLKNNSSPGDDGIKPRTVKSIKRVLTTLIWKKSSSSYDKENLS
jgi:hypothetical protein